jgi:hypothetical protein
MGEFKKLIFTAFLTIVVNIFVLSTTLKLYGADIVDIGIDSFIRSVWQRPLGTEKAEMILHPNLQETEGVDNTAVREKYLKGRKDGDLSFADALQANMMYLIENSGVTYQLPSNAGFGQLDTATAKFFGPREGLAPQAAEQPAKERSITDKILGRNRPRPGN